MDELIAIILNFVGAAFYIGLFVWAIKKNKQKLKTDQSKHNNSVGGLGKQPSLSWGGLITLLVKTAQDGYSAEDGNFSDSDKSAMDKPSSMPVVFSDLRSLAPPLDRHTKYLQIALNSTVDEARNILQQLPLSERVIIEAGTPLIKKYGLSVVGKLRAYAGRLVYIVADIKTADMGEKEVELSAQAGAQAVTCVGVAPIPTIDNFIAACEKYKLDAMIDMMNVEEPEVVLKKLKKIPKVVILHRGVDEIESDKGKMLPTYQINQIKGMFNVLVAVAGADSSREVQSAVFNGVDIVVLWKAFYKAEGEVGGVIREFLEEVR